MQNLSFTVSARTLKSFEQIEALSPELRECVHEYGFAIVKACMMAGVARPAMIHLLVREIWEGARQHTQRRPKLGTLDWVLMQTGCDITGPKLLRVLRNNDLLVVPVCPNNKMLAASMKEVSDHNVRCTKEEKHRRRLRAANTAGAINAEPAND